MNLQLFAKQITNKFSKDSNIYINCLRAYSDYKQISFENNSLLKKYLIKADLTLSRDIQELFLEKQITLQQLALLFQYFWNEEDIKAFGIVYTDVQITEFIIKNALNKGKQIGKLCDPSCGSGIFLLYALQLFYEKYQVSYEDICKNYLYGFDIKEESIIQTKCLLSIFLLEHGIKEDIDLKIYQKNSLCLKEISAFKNGFTYIVGNPPYVRAKNIPLEVKKEFEYWKTAKEGNPDLYIPFFELGLYLLNDSGILGYISPNTFIQSVNGRNLRKYLSAEKYNINIIDFRDAQLFSSVTSYTCIILINSGEKESKLFYSRIKKDINNLKETQYSTTDFTNGVPWRLGSHEVDKIIYQLENSGKKLNDWKIRNGLATLKNDLFIFTPTKCDELYFYREYNNKTYKIEKSICMKIVKPNIMKNEQDLVAKMEYGIFPYEKQKDGFGVIDEKSFITKYPYAYNFLCEYKSVLQNRDKGKSEYPAWYAYGRTQGMNNQGKKLLIPYLNTEPIAIISEDEKLLFYCGYAVFADTVEELKILKLFLESSAFWYYLKHTSKPYANGSRSFAKNYIKNFSIPNLTDSDKEYLLGEADKTKIDEFILHKYNIIELLEDA